MHSQKYFGINKHKILLGNLKFPTKFIVAFIAFDFTKKKMA